MPPREPIDALLREQHQLAVTLDNSSVALGREQMKIRVLRWMNRHQEALGSADLVDSLLHELESGEKG